MKQETNENKVSFWAKLKYTGQFVSVGSVIVLAGLGAGVVKTNLHWGTAMANEVTQSIDSNHVVMPKPLKPVSEGEARCLVNAADNEAKAARCHELFAVKSDVQFSEVY